MIGKCLGKRYRIAEEFGRGRMSVVYKAQDLVEDRSVAVKFLSEEMIGGGLENILRFRRESAVVAGLSHPNIVRVYEIGEEEGIHYIIMEFIEGEELGLFMKKKYDIVLAIDIIRQIVTGLVYVHSKGVIHRDIKPGNIMVTNGTAPVVKILDFGVARLINLADITESEEIVGTFPYMSPEQVGLFDRPVDERSDLYSVGIIFYELATGGLPFKGDDVGSLIHQHLAKIPRRPLELVPKLPRVIDGIIMKLLQKEMEDRYQTAMGLVYDLDKTVELIKEGREDREFKLGLGDRVRGLSYRTRLIGRKKEFNRLKLAFDKACDGMGGMEMIGGVAGIGKTRLCNELRSYVREKDGVFISGRSYEHKGALPYNPFKEALDEYIDVISRFPKEKKDISIKCIKEVIGELGQLVIDFSPPMKECLGEVPSIVRLDPGREKERFLRTISDLYTGMTGHGISLVLFLDDLQWADEGTMELLHYLMGRIRDANMLIIGTYRSEEVDSRHPLHKLDETFEKEGLPVDRIDLVPLEIRDSEEMVSEILGQEIYGMKKWKEDILGVTEGNPFFVGEMIRNLVDGGGIYQEDGTWEINPGLKEGINVPSTVTDLVLRRIQRVSTDTQDILTLASAIGKEFSFDVLLEISNRDAGILLDILDEGVRLRLIIESGGIIRRGYNFIHDNIRQALYNRLDINQRKGIHQWIGESLERIYKGDIESIIYELANHFILSGNKEKIIQYALKAGDKAKSLYANLSAKHFYETTVSLLPPQSTLYITTKESLGDIYMLLGEYPKAIEVYKELLDLAKARKDKGRFEGKLGDVYFKIGDLPASIHYHRVGLGYFGLRLPETNLGTYASLLIQALIQLFHTLFPIFFLRRKKVSSESSEWGIARTLIMLSHPYWFYDLTRCLETHLILLNRTELLGESKELVRAYSDHGVVVSAVPLFKRAIRYQKRGIAISERLNERWGIAQAKSFLGLSYFYSSQWDKSIAILKESVEELTRLGDPFECWVAFQHLGYSCYMKGQFQRSIECLENALDVATRVGDIRSMGQALGGLGVVLYLQGDKDTGRQDVEKAVEYSRKSYDNLVLAMNLRDAGYIYLNERDYNSALKSLHESKDLIEKYHFRSSYVVETYIGLARAYLGDIEGFGKLPNKEKKIKAKKIKRLIRSFIGPFGMARFYRNYLGYAYRVAGQYYWAMGKGKKAVKYLNKSIGICKELGAEYELGLSYYELGRIILPLGERE